MVINFMNAQPIIVSALLGLFTVTIAVGFLKLQERQVTDQVKKSSHWMFTAGGHGRRYLDVDLMLQTPEGSAVVCNWINEQIRIIEAKSGLIDKLVFVEKDSGPIGMIAAMSLIVYETGKPAIIIRAKRKVKPGMVKLPPNAHLNNGDKVVLISDVANTSRTITKAVDLLRQTVDFKVEIPYALVLFDLNSGAREQLRESGTELISLKQVEQDEYRIKS
jgi:orotate phosphoribosyltransferase